MWTISKAETFILFICVTFIITLNFYFKMKIHNRTQYLLFFFSLFHRVSSIKHVEVVPFSLKSSCSYVWLILVIKYFWLHIRSQLHVTTEPLKLRTKTTSQYKKHRVIYLIFCYWDKPVKFHRCQRLTAFSVTSLCVVILAIFTLCFYRPWKSVILFTFLRCSEIFEQYVWWLAASVV